VSRAAEAILFDALGTLVGIEPPFRPLVGLLADRHGVAVAMPDMVRALRAEMAYYRAHCQTAGDAESLTRLRADCADVVAGELGGAVAALDRGALTEALLDALRFAAYPEVPDVLRRLRAAGRRLVVVSNWDVSLHEALDRAGLSALLDGVVCSAEVGAAKPAEAIFAAGLARAGARREQALHVGDSLAEDVAGARAAGIEAVLLTRPPAGPGGLLCAGCDGRPEGVRTIASLAGLVDP
jgi:putative hydrolase of the HAD superfamily